MKSQATSRQSEPRRRRRSGAFLGLGIIILGIALVIGFAVLLSEPNSDGQVTLVTDNGIEKSLTDSNDTAVEGKKLPAKLDFQSLAEAWVKSSTGKASVYIYDLDYDEPIAAVNENVSYNTASLYKLFPVYEGYRRVYRGDWNGDELLVGRRTINQCLDAAIRSSDSTCGEALWDKIGRSKLDAIIKDDYKITNSRISSLLSNPVDIAKILERYYYHPDFDSETRSIIFNSMWNQPAIDNGNCYGLCVWRQGLPAGLEDNGIMVYDKVGWEGNEGGTWNYYHDAAIVTAGDHHLIVVAMTSNIRSYSELTNLGAQLKEKLK